MSDLGYLAVCCGSSDLIATRISIVVVGEQDNNPEV